MPYAPAPALGRRLRPGPGLDPVAADRARAAAELAPRFAVVAKPDPNVPNQVTQPELDALVELYSDVRLGRAHLKLASGSKDDFRAKAMADIASILQTPSGRELLHEVAYAPRKDGSFSNTTLAEKAVASSAATWLTDPAKRDDKSNGVGASATIGYAAGESARVPGATDAWWPQRSDVTLYHEMVHAYHIGHGTLAEGRVGGKAPAGDQGIDLDEYQAVGLGRFAKERFTENRYRAERARLVGLAGGLTTDHEAGVRREAYTPTCAHGELEKDAHGLQCTVK